MKLSSTETFIEKARAIHGDKYDYSNVTYTTAITKVEIICPSHGSFMQIPNSHLNGNGCPACALERKRAAFSSNTEAFITQAKAIHGDKYDYSKVKYVNNRTKVTIVCPVHGDFQQQPSSHINQKAGCKKCALQHNNAMSNSAAAERFAEKVRAIHGDKYDYSEMVYTTSTAKVKVICPVHGAFYQSPSNLLHGNGCPSCSKAASTQKLHAAFLLDAKAVHGDRYVYDNTVYAGVDVKVTIECRVHGAFLQTPAHHTNGSGCPACKGANISAAKTRDTDTVIALARHTHGTRYDYSQLEYVNCKEKVTIVCPTHGAFSQTMDNHISGQGCPKCAHTTSQPELDIAAIAKAAGYDVEHRYRPAWMKGKELDIYIPVLNLAIEYCGSHVHNVDRNLLGGDAKPKTYHYDKWKTCRDNGVTLLTIYDFQWKANREKITSMIKHKLRQPDRRVHARKCEVVELDRATCWNFVKTNHIEGTGVWKHTCTYKGLRYNGELVAVMVEQDKDIKRSCTLSGTAVIGGVSKLFKQFPKGTTMMTTNDTGSSGNYGIKIDKYTLRYWWVNLRTRESHTRRTCQKHLLEAKFGVPVGNMTEVQYMTALGFVRVFDSGLSYFVNAV